MLVVVIKWWNVEGSLSVMLSLCGHTFSLSVLVSEGVMEGDWRYRKHDEVE